jgi:hypothetical protein
MDLVLTCRLLNNLSLLNFKHQGKIMDSGEHNGFVQEWKTFLANIEEVGKRKLRGRYGNA